MSANISRDQLKAFIERIERMEEDKKSIADDIKDIYSEAAGAGFDAKAMKTIIRLRRKTEEERQEEDLILDTYMAALNMLPSE